MKKVLISLMLIASFAFLSGCGGTTEQGKGSLVIRVSQPEFKLKTIQPSPEDITIATFDVSGTGPNGTSFQKNNIPAGTAATINALAVGEWTIVVTAKNAAGSAIAAGVNPNVFVVAGITNSAEIELKPATGTGELNVSLS
ncbi:MAG TPA: hypothetical protein VHY08_17135 [Bacillota bacterium]|nr:hypothetical protein [Bacillota bacterium]